MSNEHNPIAQLITQIQASWQENISNTPHINLVQWLIKPEESRLYNGFLKLESSPHGSLDELFLVMLTPFTDDKSHSKQLINDCVTMFTKHSDTITQYQNSNPNFSWNPEHYQNKLSDNTNHNNSMLVDMLSDLQQQLNPKTDLVFALLPYSYASISNYSAWILDCMKHITSESLKFVVFDHIGERYFDGLVYTLKDRSKSIYVPIDLASAMNKIAKSGDPNEPEVQLRQCMLKMSEASQKKELNTLKKWGEKAIEVTQKSGSKNLFSSAHLIYAGLLFNFSEFETIDSLLTQGIKIAKSGIDSGDDSCITILLQLYGFKASSHQHQKEYNEAFTLFNKQAEFAKDNMLHQQALNAWWLAYNVIKKDKQRYKSTLETAYNHGSSIDAQLLKSTVMPQIAYDYYDIADNERNTQLCNDINTFMETVEGEQWRDIVAGQRKNTQNTTSKILNWF